MCFCLQQNCEGKFKTFCAFFSYLSLNCIIPLRKKEKKRWKIKKQIEPENKDKVKQKVTNQKPNKNTLTLKHFIRESLEQSEIELTPGFKNTSLIRIQRNF